MKTLSVGGINYSVVNANGYFNATNFNALIQFLQQNLYKSNIILEIPTTKGLDPYQMSELQRLPYSNRLRIRVIGGHDDQHLQYGNRYLYEDNVYTTTELKKILEEIRNIERGINNNWDDFQKLMYLIGYLKNKIIYHPFFETVPSKDIRSLTGLTSGKTVCAGYALILKELCDRNGIECHYVIGSCNEEDAAKNKTTHAWNIVRINGEYVPLDLTWNAGNNNRGKMLDIDDLFNANEFAKHHYPGRFETIRNYKTLKSIDGHHVRLISNIINKDMVYDNTTLYGDRVDGSRYRITLVDEKTIDNKKMYRYIYQRQDSSGRLGVPVIVYSGTNINGIVFSYNEIEKTKKKAQEALARGDRQEYKNLMDSVSPEKIKHIVDAYNRVDDLLFSKKNLQEALARRDYYVGKMNFEYDSNGNLAYTGVEIDVDLATNNKKSQKTCIRSDGTSFVLEEYGKLRVGNSEVFRYRLYEPVYENGNYKVKKDTIFTDKDVLLDNRQDLYDIFFSRSRLDRKKKEANGYLGYYSADKIKTYSEATQAYFSNDLCRKHRLGRESIRNYYNEVTFGEMERLVISYDKEEINGVNTYYNVVTRRVVTDEDLKMRIEFAHLWLFASGLVAKDGDRKYGLTDAFVARKKEIFDYLSEIITNSMNSSGNIDPVTILERTQKNPKYQDAVPIVVRLFSSKEAVQLINKLYRLQNPSAMKEDGNITFFSMGRMSNAKMLLEKRRRLQEAKEFLEVVATRNNEVVIRKK